MIMIYGQGDFDSYREALMAAGAETVGFEPTDRLITDQTISSNFETVPLRRHIEAVHGSYYALNPLKNQDFLSI